MTTTYAPSPYTALSGEQTLADTVLALQEHGCPFVVDHLHRHP